MQSKVFILSFVSAAKHRLWRTGDWLVEIQNIYVELKHLFPHLCTEHTVFPEKKGRNGKEHPLFLLSDAGPFCSDLSNQCKEQILMWSLYWGTCSLLCRFLFAMILLVLKAACTAYTAASKG